MRSNFSTKPVISHVVMMGDSLSDRGTLNHRYLFGIIPMARLTGLSGKSPRGRFTNGFAWSDHISAMFINEFIIQRALKLDATDIADNVITNPQFQHITEHSYTLDNDLYVQYRGRDFVRNYDEGGLTSHSYSGKPSKSIKRFVDRLLVSTLTKKRKALLKHDNQIEISREQKKQTLVIEWSGANDLITANAKPSITEADMAINDRIENAEKLIQKGYRHFYLFDLPDLSLIPQFQNMPGITGERARENAKKVSLYFNEKLKTTSAALQKKYQHIGTSIEVFDIGHLFTDIYNDAINQTHRYPCYFDKNKVQSSFTQSKDFIDKNGLSPASGYIFWDNMHPSSDMHALIADEFYKSFSKKFLIAPPKIENAKMLCDAFIKKYHEIYNKDRKGYFGFFRHSNLPDIDFSNPVRAIAMILKHALEENGKRTRKAISQMQWIDSKGNINIQIPALHEAKKELAAISRSAMTLK
jgi:phospholipase/lecithinase/hemolysin